MTQDSLSQIYIKEWKINPTNSSFTPAFFPNRDFDVKIVFQVKRAINIISNVNENYTINAHTLGSCRNVKLRIFVSLHSENEKELLKLTKEIIYEKPGCIELGKSEVYKLAIPYHNNYCTLNKTAHCTETYETGGSGIFGILTLKCEIIMSGHLGSYSLYNQQLNALSNRSEFMKDFSCLYLSKLYSDLTVKVANETFSAHKVILVTHSPVFKKMMESNLLESKTNIITISDSKPEIFECFLKYLYVGEIVEELQEADIKELYALADKYDVSALRKECARLLALDINLDNIFEVLYFAYDSNNDIKHSAKSFAVENISALKSTSEWGDMKKNSPRIVCDILEKIYAATTEKFDITEEKTSK